MNRIVICSLLIGLSVCAGCQQTPSDDITVSESESKLSERPHTDERQSEREAAISMLKNILLGCHKYSSSHEGMLPSSLHEIQSYVERPFNPDDYILVASGTVHVKKAGNIVLIEQKAPLSSGERVVACLDYHIKVVPER